MRLAPRSELHGAHAGRASLRVLAGLVLVDLAFTCLFAASVFLHEAFDVTLEAFLAFNGEESLASTWGYSKYAIAIALFHALFRETRNTGYLVLGAVVLFFLLDDALEIHDALAYAIGTGLGGETLAEMHPQDRGEPIVFAGMLGVTLGLLFAAHRRLTEGHRAVFVNFAWAVLVLAICGAAIDVAHGVVAAFLDGSRGLEVAVAALEDGGELIAVSLILFTGLDRLLFLTYAAGQREGVGRA